MPNLDSCRDRLPCQPAAFRGAPRRRQCFAELVRTHQPGTVAGWRAGPMSAWCSFSSRRGRSADVTAPGEGGRAPGRRLCLFFWNDLSWSRHSASGAASVVLHRACGSDLAKILGLQRDEVL